MATTWRRAMLYLGLGPDDEYEDDGYAGDDQPSGSPAVRPTAARPDQRQAPPGEGQPRPVKKKAARPKAPPPSERGQAPREAPPQRSQRPAGGGRSRPPAPEDARPEPEPTSVRPLPGAGDQPATPKAKPVVRPVPAASKPYVVSPSHFNHAQEVADRFKNTQPVILNLQGVDKDLARRLIDFCSGLCYGLVGHMEKVAQQVYLLTPTDVEVSAEERRRLHERGLHDA